MQVLLILKRLYQRKTLIKILRNLQGEMMPRSMGYDPDRPSGRIMSIYKRSRLRLFVKGFVALNPHLAANSTFRISYYFALN